MLEFARLAIFASWLVLFGFFVLVWWRAREGRRESGRRSNPASLAGMALEFAALALVPPFYVDDPGLPAWGYAVATAVAASSAAFGISASMHLGKQLRMQAVVTDDHRLVTSGPYRVVRHPIYASLLGLLVPTALVLSDARALAAVIPVFIVGTEIRVRAEEKLLAGHFGAQFEDYRRRVRAYLPGVR